MTCPYCDAKTIVHDSRDLGDHVVRERLCLECGERFYTEEVDSETAEEELRAFRRDISRTRRSRARKEAET